MRTDSFTVDELFEVTSGDFHDAMSLDEGTVPLISCGELSQGLVGYYDIPKENIYRNCLTVAYNGCPLTTKFHPYEFAAKDDVAVLKPKTDMGLNALLYVAASLNSMKWRYHYGRKCFKAKLKTVRLSLPAQGEGKKKKFDVAFVDKNFRVDFHAILPKSGNGGFKIFTR